MSQLNQQQKSYRLPEENIVILVGRVSRAPDLRRTSTGKAVCSFDIAISRRMKDTTTGDWIDAEPTFVPIIVWGEQAERCAGRLEKGFPVHVEGRLQTNKWEGNDGIKRSRLEVIASRVQFLMMIRQDSPAAGGGVVNELQEQSDDSDEDDENDIPF
ncbi:MAG: single-stranded DNA-binding protein [Endomicrobium sp.]|jgi:single-strand DNA-binding protein|nr:single-stranded DNA-binding protein [Endomicrobium sp.]